MPDFTLITGLNGAGKSHLLEAIMNGSLSASINGTNIFLPEIKFASWQTLIPNDAGAFAEGALEQERFSYLQQFRSRVEQLKEGFQAQIRSWGLSDRLATDWKLLWTLTDETVVSYSNGNLPPHTLIANIRAVLQNHSQHVRNADQNVAFHKLLDTAAEKAGVPIFALTNNDLSSARVPSWGTADLFQNQFGRLFVQYRALQKTNWLRRYLAHRGELRSDILSDEEFAKQYGPPPWEFVNAAIRDAGLDFEINAPDEVSTDTFDPKITKTSTGAEIPFGALSSGEKVLMSFAMVLYYADDQRSLMSYPKLLLLDEVDASLHPSMSAHLIRVIKKTLVERTGIRVIATTHSPSTVALAPEAAIHVMRALDAGVHKTTTAQALNILTHGVPTLALTFQGRRQVFVEAPIDAKIYSKLWLYLKPHIATDRSIEFMSPGIKDKKKGSDVHTGCDVVKHLVKTVSEAGVASVYGLVDWDCKNVSSDRVIVMSANVRYGLENFLLDPRLVGALLLHTPDLDDARRCRLGMKGLTYSKYRVLEPDQLLFITTAIAKEIFGEDTQPDTDVTYTDGVKLKIAKRYLSHPGHELAETLLPDKFPTLKRYGTDPGKLMNQMLKTIIEDAPEMLPRDALDAFERIGNDQAH